MLRVHAHAELQSRARGKDFLEQRPEAFELAEGIEHHVIGEREHLAQVKGGGREILEKSLTQGEASSLTHLILGTCDLIIGNHESAQIHLEQARALDQGSRLSAVRLAEEPIMIG